MTLALVMVCGGIVARTFHLGLPNAYIFDEHHFVENARNLLQGRHDWNDHPPLGKLIIAVGMLTLADDSLGWRLMPMLLGVGLIGMAYGLGTTAFKSRVAGALAAGFVAIDGFLIAYSKSALLDGMLVFFEMSAVLVALRARRVRGVLLSGLLAGCALSIKFSGVVLALPMGAAIFVNIRPWHRALQAATGAAVLALGVYVTQFAFGLGMAGEANDIAAVADKTLALYRHHAGATEWKNPLTSRWYTWFVPVRPITMYRQDYADGWLRTMTSLGNPLLWWASLVAIAACGGLGLRRALRTSRRLSLDGYGFIALCWIAPLAPWWLTERDSYIYHYLGSYAFGLVGLAGIVALCLRRRYLASLSFVLAALCMSAFLAPLWMKTPLSRTGLDARLFVPAWRGGP